MSREFQLGGLQQVLPGYERFFQKVGVKLKEKEEKSFEIPIHPVARTLFEIADLNPQDNGQKRKIGELIEYLRLRGEFLESLSKLYPPEDVHGLDHAKKVEQRAFEVLEIARKETKQRDEEIIVNSLVLTLAALGHDVGYTAGERNSLDKFEHQSEGVKIIKRIIDKNFGLSQREKAGILMLIWMHDNTAFTYPLKSRGGEPLLREKQIRQREEVVEKLGFLTELRILREADSFFATGEVGLKRTIEFSTRKGLPFFADGDSPLRADMWEVSITGNLRLSSRRAFEDAFTQRGKTLAAVGWLVQEKEIFSRCRKEGIEYYLDPGLITSLLNWHENS